MYANEPALWKQCTVGTIAMATERSVCLSVTPLHISVVVSQSAVNLHIAVRSAKSG